MSVTGEFHRYLDQYIDELSVSGVTDAEALATDLRAIADDATQDLSGRAAEVVRLLADQQPKGGQSASVDSNNLQLTREYLVDIAKIILGR